MLGGTGKDLYYFNTSLNAKTNVDAIKDFSHRDDTMALENAVFKTVGKAGKLASSAFYTGSAAHDSIRWDAEDESYRRDTTLAGGIEGGISTGELLVVRAAMKPLATLNVPVLETVDTATKEATVSFKERTDVTAVPAMGVVAETMVALVLAAEAQRKFGGDSVAELTRNAAAFRAQLG